MDNLKALEIKVFIPAKNFNLSKQFYEDIGFIKASDDNGIAYFYNEKCSFLLQDFYDKALAQNLMMHLLVEDIHSWHDKLTKANISKKYDVKLTTITKQPWDMLEFILTDPSGVVWRIAQNI